MANGEPPRPHAAGIQFNRREAEDGADLAAIGAAGIRATAIRATLRATRIGRPRVANAGPHVAASGVAATVVPSPPIRQVLVEVARERGEEGEADPPLHRQTPLTTTPPGAGATATLPPL